LAAGLIAAGAASGAGQGALAGALIGSGAKNKETKDEEKLLDKMADVYREQGSATFDRAHLEKLLEADKSFGEDWVTQNQKLLDSVLGPENLDATKELIKGMYDNTQAQLAANKLLAQQATEGNSWVVHSEYKDIINTIQGAERKALIDAELARLKEEKTGTAGINKA
jgi:hypothetical protein